MNASTPPIDVAVVGGGAAGLTAGIFAAEALLGLPEFAPVRDPLPPGRVVILDGAARLGAKILVAGGGRCNVTHEAVSPEDFNAGGGPRECRSIVRNVLRGFDERQTVRWFASMGVELKREDTGKLFPTTDKARTVLDALLGRCRSLGVEVRTGHRVTAIDRAASAAGNGPADLAGFIIGFEAGDPSPMHADRVILATGGQSLPKTGSDGLGYRLAEGLGHTVSDTGPALVPLVLDRGFIHAGLSGVSHEATLEVYVGGRRADRRTGSLLWTHFGVSGPVVLDASRFWVKADLAGEEADVLLDLSAGRGFDDLERALVQAGRVRGSETLSTWWGRRRTGVPARVFEAVARYARVNPDLPLSKLSRVDRRELAHALTGLPLPVERDRGWNYAEVTAGGVPLAEISQKTMASRKAPGLFLCGEILDVEGRIGGFNFQWAWASGCRAGRAAAGSLDGA